MTIPDDPRVHGLLRLALDALRRMLGQQEQAGSASSSHEQAAADELPPALGQPPGALPDGPPVWRRIISGSGSGSSSSSSADASSELPPLQDACQKPAALPGCGEAPEPAVGPMAVAAFGLRRRRGG
ncbi:hypothetical protein ABPG75_006145 [Micractinium tetrahymenae]